MDDTSYSTHADPVTGSEKPDRTSGLQTGIANAARREMRDLRNITSGIADRVDEEGSKAKTTALRIMIDEIDSRKMQLVDGLMLVTDAVRDVSEQQEKPSAMMTQALQLLENATDTLDGHSMQDFGTMIAGYSRRNPATFVAGCLLTGLALGRFITATAPNKTAGSASDNNQFGSRSYEPSPFEMQTEDHPANPAEQFGAPSMLRDEGTRDGSA